jgi:hypothetical protein
MKIVINKCHGGFGLNHEATLLYGKLKGLNIVWEVDKSKLYHYYIGEISDDTYFADWDIQRTDPALIEVVEKLGENAGGRGAELKVVEIPDDVDWQLQEYDGNEWIAEKHRTWK